MSNWHNDPHHTETSWPGLPPLPGQPQQPGFPPPPPPGYGPPPGPHGGYGPQQGHPGGYGPQPAYGPPGYPGPGAPPPPRRRSNTGLWIGLGVGGGVLLLLGILCLGPLGLGAYFAASDGGSNSGSDYTAPTSGVDRTTARPGAGDTPPGLPPQTTPASSGKVGQPVKMKNLEFTITAKPNCGSNKLESYTSRRGKLCLVSMTVVNRGTTTVDWSMAYASLYVNDRDYITASISCEKATSLEAYKQFKAGESWTTTGCYDMESNLTPARMRYTEFNQGDETWVDLS